MIFYKELFCVYFCAWLKRRRQRTSLKSESSDLSKHRFSKNIIPFLFVFFTIQLRRVFSLSLQGSACPNCSHYWWTLSRRRCCSSRCSRTFCSSHNGSRSSSSLRRLPRKPGNSLSWAGNRGGTAWGGSFRPCSPTGQRCNRRCTSRGFRRQSRPLRRIPCRSGRRGPSRDTCRTECRRQFLTSRDTFYDRGSVREGAAVLYRLCSDSDRSHGK